MVEVLGEKSGAQHKAMTFCLLKLTFSIWKTGGNAFCFHAQTNVSQVAFQRGHQHVANLWEAAAAQDSPVSENSNREALQKSLW